MHKMDTVDRRATRRFRLCGSALQIWFGVCLGFGVWLTHLFDSTGRRAIGGKFDFDYFLRN
jgi:hypothetical protein